MPFENDLHKMVLDSLLAQIAVVNQSGTIIYVNFAWKQFAAENGISSDLNWIGVDYLNVCDSSSLCGDSLADASAQGIRYVLSGKQDYFYYEYPCHSPNEKRWFMLRVTPLRGASKSHFVLSHHNITQRKLTEELVEHLSLHDSLTGLSNRRHFNQFLSSEWRRSIRSKIPVSLIMLDIDHFKDFNDDLGHIAGDKCLEDVSEVIKIFAQRPTDLAVRYGGEEFILLLGNTDLREASNIAEKALQCVSELNIKYCGGRLITISAGVASITPEIGLSEDYLIAEADKALYNAKNSGRNRICTA